MQSKKVVVLTRDRLEAALGSVGLFGFKLTRGAGRRAYNAADALDKVDRPFTIQVNGRTRLVVPRPIGHRQLDPVESTGRTRPGSREEAAFMSMARENAAYGTELTRVTLRDPRWPSTEGWVKMSMEDTERGIEIHYVYNPTTFEAADFKFKDRTEPNT
ncbi:hypothetical protein [Nocardia grenadensis]|uniref:hypothetical protein n=1 Tax=Nocardia grenadensis TaxID=931537 RepID=UPI003D89EE80